MSAEAPGLREHGNSYNIFILVLTLFSLALMALQLLPLSSETRHLVSVYDNAVCIIFLLDFAMNLIGSKPKRIYFIEHRGWLDLLGSIPTFGIFPFTALFRLARLSRLARITRLLGGQNRRQLLADLLANRSQYATLVTVLLAGMVLSTASIVVLQQESRSADANIQTGGDALWWAIVTITTVGYGDYFPVTTFGRITAVFVMLAGVGIIGALASILASLLVAPAPAEEGQAVKTTAPASDATDVIARELAGLRSELAGQRAEIAALRAALADPTG